MILGELRKRIENQRNSKKIFWIFLITIKDTCWKIYEFYHKIRINNRPINLSRLDKKKIPKNKNEIRAFMVVRNESTRLPYILKHYFSRGIDRFFIIDNNSDDDTVPFLLSQENVHVFTTKDSYGKSECGNLWLRHILKLYAENHWCLVVDADEILIYPHFEEVSFKELRSFLETENSTVLSSLLIDMYSDKSVQSTSYKKGDDLMSSFKYFDGTHDDIIVINEWWDGGTLYKAYRGGARKRVFSVKTLLNKANFFKYNPGVFVGLGQHSVKNVLISKLTGVTLHYKYISGFNEFVLRETKRGEHWNNAEEYKIMARKIKSNPNFTLFYPKSVQFKNSKQFIDLKFMKTTKEFESFVKKSSI